jgi:hypothetical protein
MWRIGRKKDQPAKTIDEERCVLASDVQGERIAGAQRRELQSQLCAVDDSTAIDGLGSVEKSHDRTPRRFHLVAQGVVGGLVGMAGDCLRGAVDIVEKRSFNVVQFVVLGSGKALRQREVVKHGRIHRSCRLQSMQPEVGSLKLWKIEAGRGEPKVKSCLLLLESTNRIEKEGGGKRRRKPA